MSLTRRSIGILLDLVEIKLSYMNISDREDARDLQLLERCRAELKALDRGEGAAVVPLAGPARRPARARAASATRQAVPTARQPLIR